MMIARLSDSQFDEMFSYFLDGLKEAVKNNQFALATHRLDKSLRKSLQKDDIDSNTYDDFMNFIKQNMSDGGKRIYLRNKEGQSLREKWTNEGIPETSMKRADDALSWQKLIDGEFDEKIKNAVERSFEQNSAEDLMSDADLLQEIFDVLIMKFVEFGESIKNLNNARMFLKSLPQFVKFIGINKFRKEKKTNIDREKQPKEREEQISGDPLKALSDEQIFNDFLKFLKKQVSTKRAKGISEESVSFVANNIIQEGGLKKGFSISDFFNNYEKELNVLDINKKSKLYEVVAIVKEAAREFIEKESPGMIERMSKS
jgi:hypothetical protein